MPAREALNRAWLALIAAWRRARRSAMTGAGTCSMAAAGVPGRGLYLNEKAEA